MKILTNKNIIQKMLIVLVILMLFNFIAPSYSHAGIGGALIDPIQSLVLGLGDAIMWGLQRMIFGMDQSIIYIDNGESFWSKLFGGIAFAIGAAAVVVLSIATGGLLTVGIGAVLIAGGAAGLTTYVLAKEFLPDDLYLPLFILSPQEIFANKVPILDINFIEEKTEDKAQNEEGTSAMATPAYILRNVIARWYIVLRNIAFVGLLSILIFIGVKITLTSIAAEKAKYKNMIVDWVVAMCLLLLMQFFMSFMLNLTEAITNIFNNQNTEVVVELPMTDKIRKAIGVENVEGLETNKDGDEILKWPTNFTGVARIESQLGEQYGDNETNSILHELSYTVMYVALIGMTLIFLFTYLKRVLYMAFLTIIAPLVVLTYPLDKITDGKAQAFNMWIKEYAYNLLIQPFHLLLYMILVGTAMDFAKSNLLYALVALGFIGTAEKLLRRFFGFEKAGTAGALGGFVGGALASKLFGGAKKGLNKSNVGKEGKEGDDKIRKTNTRTNPYQSIIDSAPSEGRFSENTSSASQNSEENGADRDIDNENRDNENRDGANRDGENTDNNRNNYAGAGREQHTLDELLSFDSEEERQKEREENLRRLNNEEIERRNNDPERQREVERSREERRKKEKRKEIGKRVGKAALYTAKEKGKKVAKFAGKAYLKGGGALAAGMVGLGLGALSGDPSATLKATGAAATGGYIAGKKIEGKAQRMLSSTGGGKFDTFREGYHGKEEFAKIKTKEEFMRDKTVKESFKNMYPNEGNPNRMSETAKKNMKRASEYTVEGINDYDDLERALKMEDAGMDRKSVTAAFQLSKKYDKSTLLDTKTNKEVHRTIVKNLKARGYSGNSEKQAEQTIKMMRMAQGLDKVQEL